MQSFGSCQASLLGLATELSGKLATALGVTDIVSLCVLGLVVLLALYFVWGGNWNSLLGCGRKPKEDSMACESRAARSVQFV